LNIPTRDVAESALAKMLRDKQSDAGWTDAQMAVKLGISRPYWTLLRSGDRHFGFDLLHGVTKAFPELTLEALLLLRSDDTQRNNDASDEPQTAATS
jgi:transcriptional regulator with XRE-family HTH domain